MTKQINLLGNRPSPRLFGSAPVAKLDTGKKISAAIDEADRSTMWIAAESKWADSLLTAIFGGRCPSGPSRKLGRLLMMDKPRPEQIQGLEDFFVPCAWPTPRTRWLRDDHLVEVLVSPAGGDLAIGGYVDQLTSTMTICRVDLTHVTVPLSIFRPADDGTEPDPSRFSVKDYGHTIQLGDYESSTDFVLYAADPDYRRRAKAARRAGQSGFGASLRTLRLMRKLRQEDFEPKVSRKTVMRIEAGETEPHDKTIKALAKKLGVAPDEIGTY